MRFYPADPDLATVFNRIIEGDIDLQPDFQRGEVWGTSKQQRLIDSILRGWIVPPILAISGNNHSLQVLDGQQRLVSIRDFKLGRFAIDGLITPHNTQIAELNGLRFAQLPIEVQKRFDRATVRIYEISDFSPDEPAEIFFRLNQPTPLTAAERRNAFFGPVRSQIKKVVADFESRIFDANILGFTNSRMAYDDIIGRFVCALEFGSLTKKISAAAVDELYRRESTIPSEIIQRLERSLEILARVAVNAQKAIGPFKNKNIRLTRATVHSWLLFIDRLAPKAEGDEIERFFITFESLRHSYSEDFTKLPQELTMDERRSDVLFNALMTFNDRASSRVNDALSVILRDITLWISWAYIISDDDTYCRDTKFQRLVSFSDDGHSTDLSFSEIADSLEWGVRI